MKDFEYYYNNCQEQINCAAYKYNSKLKMDLEDIKQELAILLFSNIEKIQKVDEECRNWKAYCFGMFRNHLFEKMVEEHKQGLWLSNSFESMCYFDGEYADDRFVCQHISEIGIDIKDPFLEWYREYTREYSKKYREEHKDEIREYHKIYREEHKDKIREYYKTYQEEHKEEIKLKQQKYREEHKDEMRAYKKKYYQEHKEEIKSKSKEYYRKQKETQ